MSTCSWFSSFSDAARIWFYFFPRALEKDELQDLKTRLETFIKGWNSHKEDVHGDYAVIENQLVILCAEHESISGCSIDSSVRLFKDFKAEKGVDALDRNNVFYRSAEGKIESVNRLSFPQLWEKGIVNPQSVVFDTNVGTLGELREQGIEKKLSESWHAKLVPAEIK